MILTKILQYLKHTKVKEKRSCAHLIGQAIQSKIYQLT